MKKTHLFKLLVVLAVFNPLTVMKTQAQCANPANIYSFTFSGKNYEIIKESKTWALAAQCAVERGGYLVHIDSLSEQTAIYNAILASGISSTYKAIGDGGGTSYLWIGATDKITEGTWLWDGDNNGTGTNFWKGQGTAGVGGGASVAGSYVNWGGTSTGTSQEPDDYAGNQDAGAIALASWPAGEIIIYGKAGEWNDLKITNTMYYIVEHDAPAGIERLKNKDQLRIYPNPSSDGIYVNTTGIVSIYNMEGQKMQSNKTSGNTYISIANLPNAVYVVQIETAEGVTLHKLIKK